MPADIIFPEGIQRSDREAFLRLIGLIPAEHRKEKELLRLIAFRLKIDGEAPARDYILSKIRNARACGYEGRLYDFMKDDRIESSCGFNETDPPPDLIG